ncbi:porphyrin biosynthesis protein HemD [Marvinbryantia formatexigens DSM 14469]|uniref:uroporphyrinogen-III C-methyltransferase n=1 Tax=Marvinbryantia formatexigens DSM 14469 TaxID=478749 RepID=C6L9U2_9FIRM|nr:uroporphyrinogen-III C-methyltransferase [Marvinbryantia formatexigens]EET62349.1 porphyrin biosynthesis protein HemD [Marvinbryantia formatexigens DSM 14469]UWO25096.1 uroporphyrinogen-III C-methyltransferase [Marvinbryantia formatexigens DSM 14469]SDG95262.1 uroporphyrinogen III methyltransferase / synthase [Marvinbryantia formatexigens]
MQGKVYLVGAGPADAGLFTRRGEEILKRAQVVVYDALVGQGVLGMIPRDAKLINVGKRASHHTMRQEEISRVLVEEAKQGQLVVRLKGGDPFLFGRGGEELELLVKEQIPFEVVPGVTSAISVPAYCGIPVTHRDYCSSVHIITGHRRVDKQYNIDFEALVRTGGTLVFLMGVTALADICSGLLEAGMRADMPAAVLQKGTTAAQKKIIATVSTLPEEAERRGVETPAIIVVGEVCRLAERFSWQEKKPLAGKKILVTRPRELVSEMAARLREQGAEVLELPAIRIVPRECAGEVEETLKNLRTFDWLAFTSPSGVRVFFENLKKCRLDIRSLSAVKLAVLGNGTGKELEKYGCYADLMPQQAYAQELGKALAEACRGGERILLFRAAAGSQELLEELAKVPGVVVNDLAAYDTVYETSPLIDVRAEFEEKKTDYAVFTSASTVRGFAESVPGLDFTKVRAVCIGRKTKAAADELGMETFMAEEPSMDAVVRLVEKLAGGSL